MLSLQAKRALDETREDGFVLSRCISLGAQGCVYVGHKQSSWMCLKRVTVMSWVWGPSASGVEILRTHATAGEFISPRVPGRGGAGGGVFGRRGGAGVGVTDCDASCSRLIRCVAGCVASYHTQLKYAVYPYGGYFSTGPRIGHIACTRATMRHCMLCGRYSRHCQPRCTCNRKCCCKCYLWPRTMQIKLQLAVPGVTATKHAVVTHGCPCTLTSLSKIYTCM